MIEEIIECLKSDIIPSDTENIRIARGKNKLIITFSDLRKKIKMLWRK